MSRIKQISFLTWERKYVPIHVWHHFNWLCCDGLVKFQWRNRTGVRCCGVMDQSLKSMVPRGGVVYVVTILRAWKWKCRTGRNSWLLVYRHVSRHHLAWTRDRTLEKNYYFAAYFDTARVATAPQWHNLITWHWHIETRTSTWHILMLLNSTELQGRQISDSW